MAEDFERVGQRLNNISTVKPILGAMRTISLGSWQSALKKQESLLAFDQNFQNILTLLVTKLPKGGFSTEKPQRMLVQEENSEKPEKIIMIVLGSERGLCGGFNISMSNYALKRFQQLKDEGKQVELWALGTRLIRMLNHRSNGLTYSRPLSTTALPDYALANELTIHWLKMYEAYQLDAVEVLYNRYKGPGSYAQTALRIIPPELKMKTKRSGSVKRPPGPSPIIESDPVGIYIKVIQQMTTMAFYQALINSAASEHAARFQLMEEAGQNSDRLIDEMTEMLQMYRRQSITQEMQELAVAAGLLS